MKRTNISGAHVSAKVMPYGFRVESSLETRIPCLVQKMFGYIYLETTTNYLHSEGDGERKFASRVWQ